MPKSYYDESGTIELYSPAELETRVFRLLSRFGISADLKGFKHLSTAISLVYYDKMLGKSIIKGLYPKVAAEHGTTATCVERTIRTALGRIKYGMTNVGYLGISNDEYVTAKKFINIVAGKIREENAEAAKEKENARERR